MVVTIPKAPPLVLSGPVHSGKTTFLASAIASWTASGIAVGGYLSVARPFGGPTEGYDLLDIAPGAATPFLLRAGRGEPGWPSVGAWVADPAALERAGAILRRDAGADLLVIDEIGPLELDGGGVWPFVEEVRGRGARCLFVVRDAALEAFLKKHGPPAPEVFRCGAPGLLAALTSALLLPHPGTGGRP